MCHVDYKHIYDISLDTYIRTLVPVWSKNVRWKNRGYYRLWFRSSRFCLNDKAVFYFQFKTGFLGYCVHQTFQYHPLSTIAGWKLLGQKLLGYSRVIESTSHFCGYCFWVGKHSVYYLIPGWAKVARHRFEAGFSSEWETRKLTIKWVGAIDLEDKVKKETGL